MNTGPYGIVIHGGAGAIHRHEFTPQQIDEHRAALRSAVDAAHAVLQDGGTALEAVVTALTQLEDCPLFNAGVGSALNAEGLCELDASIMDGQRQAAGAVAGVRRIRHPILLARDVMEKSPHVLMMGTGAEDFAASVGHELIDNSVLWTERGRKERDEARRHAAAGLSPDGIEQGHAKASSAPAAASKKGKYGTVGAAALDRHGHLAAGTSTGGMTNKRFGRIGDSPIIGAGTYARDGLCAVSATGHGEYFIRAVAAHDVAARVEHRRCSLRESADATIARIGALGGTGGLVAIDAHGQIARPFNAAGMFAAARTSLGENFAEVLAQETAAGH